MTDKGAHSLSLAIIAVAAVTGLIVLAVTGHEGLAEAALFFAFVVVGLLAL